MTMTSKFIAVKTLKSRNIMMFTKFGMNVLTPKTEF